jgi:hypothetical protein
VLGLGKGGALSPVLIAQATAEGVHRVQRGLEAMDRSSVTWVYVAVCNIHGANSGIKNYSPRYMEQAPSRGHEVSSQSGLGVGCELRSSSKKAA